MEGRSTARSHWFDVCEHYSKMVLRRRGLQLQTQASSRTNKSVWPYGEYGLTLTTDQTRLHLVSHLVSYISVPRTARYLAEPEIISKRRLTLIRRARCLWWQKLSKVYFVGQHVWRPEKCHWSKSVEWIPWRQIIHWRVRLWEVRTTLWSLLAVCIWNCGVWLMAISRNSPRVGLFFQPTKKPIYSKVKMLQTKKTRNRILETIQNKFTNYFSTPCMNINTPMSIEYIK